jgi:hypothetical protein
LGQGDVEGVVVERELFGDVEVKLGCGESLAEMRHARR